jgi:SAM-dependent methyltransferase
LNPPRSAYAALFLLSAGALLFQVTFVRIFSAAIWYHFAFLVVSVSLFGIGASGVALALWGGGAGRSDETGGAAHETEPSEVAAREAGMLGLAPLLFAITAIGAYLGVRATPFSPFRILQDPAQAGWFLLLDLLLAVPFFFFGLTVALVLRAWPHRAGRLYAFDLVGAAAGVLLLFFALPALGARGAIALSAVFGALAAVLLAGPGRMRMVSAVAGLAMLPLVVWPGLLPDVRLDASKPVTSEAAQPGAKLAFTRWSPLARIDVVEKPGAPPMIFLDAGAATPVTAWRDAGVAIGDVSSLAPALRRGGRVAVIGSGGGVDVQNALVLGASHVTAIEINPVILELVTGRYREAAGNVFTDPRVEVVRDEGRNFIARRDARYDVIQSTLIDTWAASASGAYSLSENYLYTVEAIGSFLDHLTPEGLLSITRWYYEAPRLASLVREALVRRGVEHPERHVMVIEQRLRSTMVVKREPFTAEESAVLAEFAGLAPDRLVQHDPSAPSDSNFFGAFLGARDPRSFYRATDFALHPVSDDSPFFFQMTRWSRLSPDVLAGFTGRGVLEPLALPVAQIVLIAALAIALLLSAVLLATPLLARAVPREGRWRWLAYFAALGVAYIVVEVVLMQRLALLLGHPTYSVTLTLFAILLFSGLGATWVDRLEAPAASLARPLLLALMAALLFTAFALPRLVPLWLPLGLPVRVALALAVIAPAAFVMGMPFPLAIRALGRGHPGHIAWGWAANGCGSVVGSVLAVLGAMLTGFTAVLVGAALVYAGALFLLMRAPEAGAGTVKVPGAIAAGGAVRKPRPD